MKQVILGGMFSLLILSGLVFAQQSGDEKKGSSMQDMMQQMMKQKQTGEGATGDMGDMGRMMGMMKMMEQCNDMMKSAHQQADKTRDSQKK